MLNRWIRYYPVLKYLNHKNALPILEVGSGSIGLGEFVSQQFTGCDIEFDSSQFTRFITPVVASADKLPFRDGEFHTVICFDMLEHVPKQLREKMLKEIIRVCNSTVIVGAPMGSDAKKTDEALLKFYEQRLKQPPQWLKEHLDEDDYPQVGEIETIIASFNIPYIKKQYENVSLHLFITKLEAIRIVSKLLTISSWKPWRYFYIPFFKLWGNIMPCYRTIFIIDKKG